MMAGYTTASQGQIPAALWPAGGSAASCDQIWPFAQMGPAATMLRGTVPGGLHFMNFPATPMALLPGQQLGLSPSGGGGEAHLGILAALNSYRPPAHEPSSHQDRQSQHHGGGGGDRNDTMSTSES
ncbi:hypothetical protein HPP92_013066 [Vanilla planifolia]|uniref:Uncharacterized protein n=1 Tax=Vanilla planifolia TaxID=51239 RepID=A0A835QMQ2_VANPL|nr:hypothetical protein HPP92_013066 [Vanilla planifolia]